MNKRTILPAMVLVLAGMLVTITEISAKVWRINNNAGVSRDFVQPQDAVNAAAVVNDDTLYLEGSAAIYGSLTLTKRLVIIGPGYLLSGTDGNPGLQHDLNNASLQYIIFDSLSSGSKIKGLVCLMYFDSNVDDITISRCYGRIQANTNKGPNTVISNLHIQECFFSGAVSIGYATNNLQITNCIFYGSNATPSFTNNTNALFRNNTVNKTGESLNMNNTYIANNIFYGSSSINAINCTFKNNISTGNFLTASNGNVNNVVASTLFIGGASMDGQHQLSAASPAKNAGETIGGITPDCGAFGTATPYRLSGIPPVPTIYSLTVPANVPSAATTMNIVFSTRSNN